MCEIRLCDDCQVELTSKLCRKNRLGIEIQTFHNPYLENPDQLFQQHQTILSNIPGKKSLHAPFWDLNLGTKMRGVRQETMDMFQYAYRLAEKLGCTEMIVHNGYIPGTSFPDGWVRRAVDFWQAFFEGKDDSITVCVENQFEEDSQILQMEIDQVNDPRLKICLDIGHAHANSAASVQDWITSLGARIHYFHLHNNHGKQLIKGYNSDEHLGLADGTIPIKSILQLAKAFCPEAVWAIECGAEYLEDSINFLKQEGYLSNRPE